MSGPRSSDSQINTDCLVCCTWQLKELGPGVVPKAAFVESWAHYEGNRRRNQAFTEELLRVLHLLAAAAVEAVPFKGPVLAECLYGDVGLRSFCDLDILVAKKDLSKAMAAIRSAGYESASHLGARAEKALLASSRQYDVPFAHPETGIKIELHWQTDADYPVESTAEAAWWSTLPTMELAGTTIRTLPTTELLVILCLHGAKHRWSCLGWLVDIAEVIRRNPDIDWPWVIATGRKMRCARRIGVGLRLAQELLEAPVPSSAVRATDGRKAVGALTKLLTVRLLGFNQDSLGMAEQLRTDLMFDSTMLQRLRTAYSWLLAPSINEWSLVSLPRPYRFLYAPIRLGRLIAKQIRGGRVH